MKNEDKLSVAKKFIENFNRKERSIITELFYSTILNTYKCECNYEQYSLQNISDYILLLPKILIIMN